MIINSKILYPFLLFILIENNICSGSTGVVCYKYKTKCSNLHFMIKVDFEEETQTYSIK